MCAPNDANQDKNKLNIDQITNKKINDVVQENKKKISKLMIMLEVC